MEKQSKFDLKVVDGEATYKAIFLRMIDKIDGQFVLIETPYGILQVIHPSKLKPLNTKINITPKFR